MKVLMVRLKEHPVELEIDGSLESMYKALECDTITCTYPWLDRVGLVADDNGLFSDKLPCRYVEELEQPIMGNFLLCGLGYEDFTDLPDELMKKYMERFWKPELIVILGGRLAVIPIDDGSEPF